MMTNMSNRKLRERKKHAVKINAALKKLFPASKIALRYGNQWQLFTAVVLSAQTTDKKVNEITARLFKKYKTADDYAKLTPAHLAKEIKEIGLYKGKAKNVVAAAKMVKKRYGGKLPKTMDAMLKLPGIGRKSANVILGNAYGIVEGIPVDTHVKRFAQKFDLSDFADPNKIERDLMAILPKKEWEMFSYRLIDYGRAICPARKHPCENHPLTKLYPPAAKTWPSTR